MGPGPGDAGGGRPDGSGVDGAAAGEGGLGTPPLVTDPDATAMAISFSLVSDSSGKTPAKGDVVRVTLEPPGTAHFFALDTTSYAALAYEGTYSLTGTELTLSFKDASFTRAGTIAFDATKGTLTLPFQAFSASKGTSTWSRDVVHISQNVQDLFESLSAVTPLKLSIAERSARVLAYAKRYATVHADLVTQALRKGALAPEKPLDLFWFVDPYVTSVYLNADGSELIMNYSDGSQATVILFSLLPRGTTTLTTSPLATDPRVNVSVTPVSSAANPPNKTAVFVAPFDAQRYYAHYPLGIPSDAEGTTYGFHDVMQLPVVQSELEGDGYTVHTILNDKVTVEAVIGALENSSPGFVLFNTHGSSNGNVSTGMFLDFTAAGTEAALQAVYQTLRNDGFGGLVDYKRSRRGPPKTLSYMCNDRSLGTETKSACFVALTPYFFEWLTAEMHADFSKSLVMFASCYTHFQPQLRNAVGARAYFDYSIAVPGPLGGAIFQYFGKQLVRHTHSAEETFYNVLRVANTHQMVYPEDVLFQDVTNFDVTTGYNIETAFHGSFAEGGSTGDYFTTGWLKTPDANPGSIWLLLLAGRGGGDAAQGSKNFATCWPLWMKGNSGGISAPWCQQASPGYAPHAAEVAYANFLLTGEKQGAGLPMVGATVPRWTLNDP